MSKATILLVDDNPANLDVLMGHLTKPGLKLLIAPSGEKALQQIAQMDAKPDLILLDVQMDTPREGFELAKKLEAEEKLCHIPIILITCIETFSASDATADIVRRTLAKYGQNDLDVLIIMSHKGDIRVEYRSGEDNSQVSLQVEGYHPKPINTEKLIRDIHQLLER